MSTQQFDPTKYKAAQRQEWDTVAAGWRKWWQTLETGAQHVSGRIVELAGLRSGQRALDIATGIGEPAVTAARAVGPSGHVVAIDTSPAMLDIARERAESLGLGNVEFQEADAEALDFPESSFDSVLCRWGLMFLPDLGGALARVRRALAPGGKFVTTVGAEAPRVPMASLAIGVLRQMVEVPSPPPGAPTLFALGEPGKLEKAIQEAGFKDVRGEELTVTVELPSGEAYVEFIQDIAAPIRALITQEAGDREGEVWRAVAAAAAKFAGPDGAVKMPNVTLCVTGTR